MNSPVHPSHLIYYLFEILPITSYGILAQSAVTVKAVTA
jgi:hypothetical protein